MIRFQNILNEEKKEKILIDKIGIPPEAAKEIVKICKNLSVWLINKYISFYVNEIKKLPNSTEKESILGNPKENIIPSLFKTNLLRTLKSDLTSIKDFIAVGLDGNIGTLENLDFNEILEKSNEWHKGLEVGDDIINYIEKGDIVLDFRNKEGIGFYWVNLNTNYSSEECERMGHCGRGGYGNTLLSLREYKKKNNFILNTSHLTAAIGESDGVIHQLKGKNNEKPDRKYHPFIIKLLLDNKFNITGISNTYSRGTDFSIADLEKPEIQFLYERKPQLFKTFALKILLNKLGITKKLIIDGKSKIFIKVNEMEDFIDKNGYKIEEILISPWDLFNYSYYNDKYNFKYNFKEINDKNLAKIKELTKKYIIENEIDLNDLNADYAVDEIGSSDNDWAEYDFFEEIGFSDLLDAINLSASDTENGEAINHYQEKLKDAFEEYGTVEEFSEKGILLSFDIGNDIINFYYDEPELIEVILDERCDNDINCVFIELIREGFIEKPEFYIDSRYTPGLDKKIFNEVLFERLGEI